MTRDALSALPNRVRLGLSEAMDECRSWIMASPRPRNRIDSASVERFHETGPDLIDAVCGAISCGQHVALAGPRGCGKSHCIDKAIVKAMDAGLVPRNGFLKIQGNKELPRDYLIEDDLTLYSSDEGVVVPKRKSAPLFRFCMRSTKAETLGRPEVMSDEKMAERLNRDMQSTDKRYVDCYALDDHGELDQSNDIKPHQRIVLFLDEVNRFSDGVLDSLLLLLEEGEAVMGGDLFRLPVVVLMTMNPPGYDASARTLSPPLAARIGRQYRLISPRLDVLTDLIVPGMIDGVVDGHAIQPNQGGVTLHPPEPALVRRAAAVTLCAWGDPRSERPGFDYLSDETKAVLVGLAKRSPTLAGAMNSLNELCHFGPDGRALGDWIKAASVAAVTEAQSLGIPTATARARHFIQSAVTTLSHKLQDNFSSASRPDNTRRKEEALYVLADTLMRSTDKKIDALLIRKIDNDTQLEKIFEGWIADFTPETVRQRLRKAGLAEEDEINRWAEFLGPLGRMKDGYAIEAVRMAAREGLYASGLLEKTAQGERLSSKATRDVVKWLVAELKKGNPTPNRQGLAEELASLGDDPPHHEEPVETKLARFGFLRKGEVWSEKYTSLRKMIENERLQGIPRLGLIQLFEGIDEVWLGAEHRGAKAADRIIDLLTKATDDEEETMSVIPADKRGAAGLFAYNTTRRMAEHRDRGAGTRQARRHLARMCRTFKHRT